MKAMVCEMCNSNDLVKQDGMFVCQHCGTKYSVEEAKKLMVEGTVSIDNSAALENYRTLARRARDEYNTDNAQKYYALIAEMDPNDWEASFFTVYFQSSNCIIAHIASACNAISSVLPTTFRLIDKLGNEADKEAAVSVITVYCTIIAETMRKSAENHYDGIDSSIRSNYSGEYQQRCNAASLILLSLSGQIENRGVEKYATAYSKLVGNLFATHSDTLKPEARIEYVENWAKCDPQKAEAYISSNIVGTYVKVSEAYLRIWKTINPNAEHLHNVQKNKVAAFTAKRGIKNAFATILGGVTFCFIGSALGAHDRYEPNTFGVVLFVLGLILTAVGSINIPKNIFRANKAKRELEELNKK